MTKFTRGSEWRKWDVQVQTRLDAGYKVLGENHGLSEEDFQSLKDLSGLTEDEITKKERQISADKYARLLLSYVQLFTDIKVLCLTDHNTGGELDAFLNEAKNYEINVIPGVEVSSNQGIHMLCLFNPEAKWKDTWANSISHLMTELSCASPFDKNKQPENCGLSSQEIMRKVAQKGGIVIFAHIATDNGLFKNFATANGGKAHIDIYTQKECVAVQIPTVGKIADGVKNVIDGKDNNYGKKSVAQFRCSDSRNLKEIGLGYTWVKANPDFQGLEQAIVEHNERLTLKSKPELLKRIELNSTKVIERVSINKKDSSDLKKEDWFTENEILLNPGLVSIIGNKGSGKSALADIIGLLGNSLQFKDFSFLNVNKFKKGKAPKASHFEASMRWYSDEETAKVCLNDDPPENATEKVKYIPQNYLEKICNNVEEVANSAFDEEIQEVIFSHVPYEERLGTGSLLDLIGLKTKQIGSNCALLREELSSVNAKIISIENKLSKKSKKLLNEKIEEKENQLKAIKEPEKVLPPDQNDASQEENKKLVAQLESLRKAVAELEAKHQESNKKISTLNTKILNLKNTKSEIESFKARTDQFKTKINVDLEEYSLKADELINLNIDYTKLDSVISTLEIGLSEEKKAVINDEGENILKQQIEGKIEEMRALELTLDAPNRKYQAYLKEVDNWKKKKQEIEGDPEQIGSLNHLKEQKKALEKLGDTLNELYEDRYELSTKIFKETNKLKTEYQNLYAPIEQFMEGEEGVDKAEDSPEIELSFSASIVHTDFLSTFLNYINKARIGYFKGAEDAPRKLAEILKTADFQTANGVRDFLSIITKALLNDSDDSLAARIQEQMNTPQKISEFYDYIFSLTYLSPKYELTWSGKKPEELSPGERGCMLLVFYLLLDKRDHPLIIDQPEENLDNQTIFKILVPCVRKAKNGRQIIVVTHNPNIAVNCDADQIICASIDKKKKNKVIYKSGAIEDQKIREQIIDILEGTIPAFVKRSNAYRLRA